LTGRWVAASEETARAEGARSASRADGRETGGVDVTDLNADPLRQLAAWLDAARAAGEPMPEAMTIASATSDGVSSARLVVRLYSDASHQGDPQSRLRRSGCIWPVIGFLGSELFGTVRKLGVPGFPSL
jgi:hypothetical protein